MLRTFFVLLPLIADYDAVSSLCQRALTVGLANSCVLSLVGFLFVFTLWSSSRVWPTGHRANPL